jgi:hypothetical protein
MGDCAISTYWIEGPISDDLCMFRVGQRTSKIKCLIREGESTVVLYTGMSHQGSKLRVCGMFSCWRTCLRVLLYVDIVMSM